MAIEDDGGSAFPALREPAYSEGTREGMSLRDWFAGQALSGLIAGRHRDDYVNIDGTTKFDILAQDAYEIAEAMLVVRMFEATLHPPEK